MPTDLGQSEASPPTRQRELAQESRKRLLAAAAAVFVERGFHRSTLQAIGERAGISRGSIGWHFKSKDGLLLAVVEHTFLSWSNHVDHDDVHGMTGLPAVLAVVDAHQRFVLDTPESNALFYSLTSEVATEPALLNRVQEMLADGLAIIRQYIVDGVKDGTIRPDVDPDAASQLIYTMLSGVGHQCVLIPGNDPSVVYEQIRASLTRLWSTSKS